MQRYEKYKDSGVDWIGEIPDHWKMLSNKYIFKLKKNQVGKKSADYELLSLTLQGIIKRDMENPEGKFPAEFDTYQEVKKGDFIFCLFDVEETPRTVGLSDFDGMITGAYTVFTASEGTDRKYLYYFYLNLDEKKRLKFLYRGLRNTIPKDSFFTFKTIFPPIEEQQTIANFLDDKTAKIDQTIAIKQKEIELLKERRQILIQKAVTKGLDDTVKLKDSGVDWIGEIPEHWEVRKLKYVFDFIKTGTTPPTANQDYFDGNINWFNPKDLNEEILLEAEKKVTDLAVSQKEIKIFPGDSILIVGIGATSGKTAYLKESATFNQQITGFHSNTQNNMFFFYFFKCATTLMLNLANYTTLPILNNEFFKSFKTIVPSIEEQAQIVSYLEEIEEKISKAILLKQQEIEKLKEYKTVLIDNVVTGKVKIN